MRQWACAEFRFDEMFTAQFGVCGCAYCRVLRCERATPDQIARTVLASVSGNAFPQQTKHGKIPMSAMHARATCFNYSLADAFIGGEIEFLRAIIAAIASRHATGLQTIRANDLPVRLMFNNQMVANGVKRISISSSGKGFSKALGEFEVEHFEA